MIEINKIYNENCLATMAKMPDNFLDLTVTSPPYDNLRTYNGSIITKRNYIGSEISSEYCEIISKRLLKEQNTLL